MLQSCQVEELICLLASLDRPALIEQFTRYHPDFPIDFTPEFLQSLPIEQLRHIFLAMCLQCQRIPELPTVQHA